MNYVSSAELKALNEKGYFRFADAMPTFSANNIGMPAGILTQVAKQPVKVLLAYRAGDEVLGGRKQILGWEDQEYYIPLVERTGGVTPYADYDDAVASGLNITFGKTGHYLFSTSYVNGERQNAQLARSGINPEAYKLESASEAIAIELNRVAFNGYINNNNTFLVTGLLNDPSLPNYISASKKFSAMSFQEVIAFFSGAVSKLRSQTGNNLQRGDKIRCAIASEAFDTLMLKFNEFGVDSISALTDRYSKLGIEFSFISALELDGANANQNVIYFILESRGGELQDTTIFGYSEIGRMSNVVVGHNFTSQKISAGTTGSICYNPAFIVRYTNI